MHSPKMPISASYNIALLTDHRYVSPAAPGNWYHQNILKDDELLAAELTRLGVRSTRLNWSDPNINWGDFDALVLRTTWDYYERAAEFSQWLDRIANLTKLINSPEAIRWNMHKRYLLELHEKGLPIVPTRMISRGTPPDLHDWLDQTGWTEAVIKPAISGGARLTFRLCHDNASEVGALISKALCSEDFLLQPFMPDISATGEDTLMILNGEYTHAVRKIPKKGDYRVQDDHGGSVHPHTPTPAQIEIARQAMLASGFDLAYGRVDLVGGSDGTPHIMELEIIEPELWLRTHPPSAKPLAEGILRRLNGW